MRSVCFLFFAGLTDVYCFVFWYLLDGFGVSGVLLDGLKMCESRVYSLFSGAVRHCL